MSSPGTPPTSHALLAEVQAELEPVERALRSHRFLAALEERRVPASRLRDFAGEQRTILAGDRRSFACLAARFPEPPAGDLFLSLAEGEGRALTHLHGFAAWLGLDEQALAAHEPAPGCQAYTAFVAWLAVNGGRADVALALLANLAAWGGGCARVAAALRDRYGAPEEAVGFFEFFTTPAPGFTEQAHAVVEAGLAAGEPPRQARRAARLLQGYELLYWDTLAVGL
jgi:thiaminase